MDITNKIEQIITEQDRLESVELNESNKIASFQSSLVTSLKKLKNMTWRQAKDELIENFRDFADYAEKAGFEDEVLFLINQSLGTKFRSLDSMTSLRVIRTTGEKKADVARNTYIDKDLAPVTEGIAQWWDDKKNSVADKQKEMKRDISLVPFKKAYVGIGKLVTGNYAGNVSVTIVYVLIWSAVAAGKIGVQKMRS